jgi:hypothetical protein
LSSAATASCGSTVHSWGSAIHSWGSVVHSWGSICIVDRFDFRCVLVIHSCGAGVGVGVGVVPIHGIILQIVVSIGPGLIGCRVVITVIVLVTGIIIRIIVVSGDRIVVIGFRHIVTIIVIVRIMVNIGSIMDLIPIEKHQARVGFLTSRKCIHPLDHIIRHG